MAAQASTYAAALAELRCGSKRGHWMWFVFPQLAGLGRSPTARFYAIGSLDEARAYLRHPVLGARYRECVAALERLPPARAEQVFGEIDALKLRSSLTLFIAASGDAAFRDALDRLCGGRADEQTVRLLAGGT